MSAYISSLRGDGDIEPCSYVSFVLHCSLHEQRKYKSSAKMLLKRGCNEILRPDMLTALYNTYMWSQVILDVMGKSLGGIRLYAFLDFLSLSPAHGFT